jgi:shikimate kinase
MIYLYRKPEECCEYILNDKNCPPLTNQESLEQEMNQLYKERNNRYCKSANIIFHRTKDLEKDAEELILKLNS